MIPSNNVFGLSMVLYHHATAAVLHGHHLVTVLYLLFVVISSIKSAELLEARIQDGLSNRGLYSAFKSIPVLLFDITEFTYYLLTHGYREHNIHSCGWVTGCFGIHKTRNVHNQTRDNFKASYSMQHGENVATIYMLDPRCKQKKKTT